MVYLSEQTACLLSFSCNTRNFHFPWPDPPGPHGPDSPVRGFASKRPAPGRPGEGAYRQRRARMALCTWRRITRLICIEVEHPWDGCDNFSARRSSGSQPDLRPECPNRPAGTLSRHCPCFSRCSESLFSPTLVKNSDEFRLKLSHSRHSGLIFNFFLTHGSSGTSIEYS